LSRAPWRAASEGDSGSTITLHTQTGVHLRQMWNKRARWVGLPIVFALLSCADLRVAAAQGTGAAPQPASAGDLPLTRAQGDAILQELKRLELLLAQRQSEQSAAGPRGAGPARMKVPVDDTEYSIGRQDAPVVVVEFVDLECPFCHRFHTTTFAQLKTDYVDSGKVRFIHRDLPLPVHAYARPAAQAARCAGAQGKFWEFRDAVLAMQDPPSADQLRAIAARLRLNAPAFESCEKSNEFEDTIRRDEDIAANAGINGTPTFVVGRVENGWLFGTALRGNRGYEAFRTAIEASLSSADANSQAPSAGSR